MKKKGKQTVVFENPPLIRGFGSAVGKKEGEGPLKKYFDCISSDDRFGEATWEKAESRFISESVRTAVRKSGMKLADADYIFCGDLLNQCAGSNFAVRELGIPFFGLYGACSTMAEALLLGAMAIDGDFGENVVSVTSSHFCSSERQFRFPLEYGGSRPASSQWTVTGSGAVVLSSVEGKVKIPSATVGKIVDLGITDANNMGAAMAPAAMDTVITHFEDTGRDFKDFDMIFTGDLGNVGYEILGSLFSEDGYSVRGRLSDCGLIIFDREKQDVHSGGSGCGCSASVLTSYILNEMLSGSFKRVLFVGTGALMSPVLTGQGESIPGIAHAIELEV